LIRRDRNRAEIIKTAHVKKARVKDPRACRIEFNQEFPGARGEPRQQRTSPQRRKSLGIGPAGNEDFSRGVYGHRFRLVVNVSAQKGGEQRGAIGGELHHERRRVLSGKDFVRLQRLGRWKVQGRGASDQAGRAGLIHRQTRNGVQRAAASDSREEPEFRSIPGQPGEKRKGGPLPPWKGVRARQKINRRGGPGEINLALAIQPQTRRKLVANSTYER